MMKILFVFFLLLNAAYFYMQFDAANEPESSAILKQPPLPRGVEQLVLLRERGLGQKTTSRPESRSSKTQQSVTQKQASAAPAKPVRKPEKIAKKPPVAQQKQRPKKTREPACFTLGPFVKTTVASRSIDALNALGVDVKRREVSRRTPKGYWVYLPASKSYQAAKRKVKALQQKGLKDLFIMGKGSRKNAISLGLFKQKNAANERFQQVKKLGLKAVLEVQHRVSKQVWLDMLVSDGKATTVAGISEIADGVKLAELTQRKCR